MSKEEQDDIMARAAMLGFQCAPYAYAVDDHAEYCVSLHLKDWHRTGRIHSFSIYEVAVVWMVIESKRLHSE